MKKNITLLYFLFIVAIIVIITFVLKGLDLSFYENYNRVISEPDSVGILELDI
jgi:hypothetical protein